MIYDAVEQVYTALAANFTNDLALLAAAKGASITTTVDLIKRQSADIFLGLGKGKSAPACGIYGSDATTQRRDQGLTAGSKRDSIVSITCDYYCEGNDPDVIAKQGELAAEAILLSMDRLPSYPGGIYAVAEQNESVQVNVTEGYEEAKADEGGRTYQRRVTVQFPTYVRDSA